MRLWPRWLWMGIAAGNNLAAVALWLFATVIDPQFVEAERWRLAAQIQFMHGMATFSCATFMNIGAKSAAKAPAFFLGGSAMVSTLIYCGAAGEGGTGSRLGILVGALAMIVGWAILVFSAREIAAVEG